MRGIVRWGLWQRRWFTAWWMLGIFAFIFINLIFYPSFRDQAAEFEQTFQQIPETAKALLSDTGDFLSPAGYLSSQVFYLMMPLLVGILAITLGASLIGKEEKEGTVELLLSRPISRGQLLAAKALVGILIVLAAGLLGTVTTAAMAKMVDLAVPTGNIMLAGAAATLLGLSFGAIALAITTLGRNARAGSIGIATLYALGGYIVVSLSSSVEWLQWPSKLFIYNYFHPGDMLEGNYSYTVFWVIAGLLLGAGIISYIAFRRRDIGA